MGSLTIKHKILRCEKCFMLKLFRIEPNYPQTTISCECNCGLNRQSILVFSKMMQMNEEYKVKCYFCGKEPKHPNYCTGCRRTYCKSCRKQHDDTIQTKTPHKFIDAFKYDFYCSTHQDEIVNSFCKNCFLNICQKCINEKLHNGHRFIKFTKMILSPQEEEALKQSIKANEEKITENQKKCYVLLIDLTDEKSKNELRDICNATVNDNKAILEVIRFFHQVYSETKYKNYNLLYNLKENIKFNPAELPSEEIVSIDKKTNDFIEYLTREFVLFKRFNSDRWNQNSTGFKASFSKKNHSTSKGSEIKKNNTNATEDGVDTISELTNEKFDTNDLYEDVEEVKDDNKKNKNKKKENNNFKDNVENEQPFNNKEEDEEEMRREEERIKEEERRKKEERRKIQEEEERKRRDEEERKRREEEKRLEEERRIEIEKKMEEQRRLEEERKSEEEKRKKQEEEERKRREEERRKKEEEEKRMEEKRRIEERRKIQEEKHREEEKRKEEERKKEEE